MGVERGARAAVRPGRGPTIVVVVLLAVGTAGCTMCPDPFDYSGPVPNGAVTQNDFCARSNGILPIGGAPRPWPTVVDADGGNATGVDPAPSEQVGSEPATTESVLRLAEAPELPNPNGAEGPNVAEETEPGQESEEVELEESEVR
jgi:hypothetical protein